MKGKIWRVLTQILCERKDTVETIKPFFENLNGYSINDENFTPILKTFSKYQLKVLYESRFITEQKYYSIFKQS